MNGGVTYHDMEKRKEDAKFLEWLEKRMPFDMAKWRTQYESRQVDPLPILGYRAMVRKADMLIESCYGCRHLLQGGDATNGCTKYPDPEYPQYARTLEDDPIRLFDDCYEEIQ